MRYRALDENNDSTFGSGKTRFLVNSAEAVAQAVRTRLLLIEGEWFLDLEAGTKYFTQVLQNGTQSTRDIEMRQRILGTVGVDSLESYSSRFDTVSRSFTLQAVVNTQYGQVFVSI